MRTFLPVTLVLVLLCPALPVEASGRANAAEDVTPAEAEARLERLTKLLRTSKSTNAEIVSALDEVAEAYGTAGSDARARDAWRKRADTQLLKALGRWNSPRGKDATGNLSGETAIHAAKIIGDVGAHLDAKGRAALSNRVRRYVDSTSFAKARKLGMSQEQLDATFDAIGRLGDPAALAWYEKHFMRTDQRQLPVLQAAHKSLVRFSDVPGTLRHAMVRELITRYAGVETQAQQGNTVAERAAKRFWDELKLVTIPALQHFAGKPTNDEGEALATVADFRRWFREHKSVKKAPWRD